MRCVSCPPSPLGDSCGQGLRSQQGLSHMEPWQPPRLYRRPDQHGERALSFSPFGLSVLDLLFACEGRATPGLPVLCLTQSFSGHRLQCCGLCLSLSSLFPSSFLWSLTAGLLACLFLFSPINLPISFPCLLLLIFFGRVGGEFL